MANAAMGALAGSNKRMLGSTIPSGSVPRIIETFSRTSCEATLLSISRSNWATTVETPSLE
ncbi:hypothetical protein D3C87_1241940 [compost metagenome]